MLIKKSKSVFNRLKLDREGSAVTECPEGSTWKKVLKNSYLHQQYSNYCHENNFIKPLYTI